MNFQGEIYLKGTKIVSFKIIDIVVTQIDYRFQDFENFHFIEFLDEKHFFTYKASFRSEKFFPNKTIFIP